MKKLFILFLAFLLIPLSFYCQDYGMNISGSYVIVHADTYLIIDDSGPLYCDLTISNTDGLTIKPNAFVTTENLNLINLPSTPDGDANLIVESNSQGTGSFIVNNNVTHTDKGRAKIQSYIEEIAGNHFMHYVGATVQDINPAYINSVRLEQFDMNYLDTYAWYWDGSAADISNYQGWINIWPYDYEVFLGQGLVLTNDVASSDVIEMFGYPKSGDITFNTHYVVGNTLELISNPYTSAIDFEVFYAQNASEILPKFNIYDNVTGNYFQYVIGGDPDLAFIQVGQGFFVNTRPYEPTHPNYIVTFSNSQKAHSNIPFRDFIPNRLRLSVDGGNNGFKDQLTIRFDEEATNYYDEELEAIKWRSINEGATMIYSIAEDDTALAINVLPIVDLNTTMTTIPVHFECGENAEYTFTFNGIESFDMGTEVWLEDVQLGNRWTSISLDGFQYQFTGSPGDPVHRFNIHFFGPTYIPEDEAAIENNSFKIYASKNHAYIFNNTQEVITNVSILNLMGQTIYQGKLPQQTLNKIYVSGQTGYYVVHVETNKNIYAEKVLILK